VTNITRSTDATGGTETGHASGTCSNYNSYKVDITHDTCVDGAATGTSTTQLRML